MHILDKATSGDRTSVIVSVNHTWALRRIMPWHWPTLISLGKRSEGLSKESAGLYQWHPNVDTSGTAIFRL